MPAVEEIEEVNARFAEADSVDAFLKVAASLMREYTNRKDKKLQLSHLVLRMEKGFVERAPPGDSQGSEGGGGAPAEAPGGQAPESASVEPPPPGTGGGGSTAAPSGSPGDPETPQGSRVESGEEPRFDSEERMICEVCGNPGASHSYTRCPGCGRQVGERCSTLVFGNKKCWVATAYQCRICYKPSEADGL